ncbi:uncharacterized protein [Ptychodera flava]|uniref:uncharacterized protein n=1 Tax=Ptychodera flava TaxID=63121 RepID=UPI003969EDE6
MAESSHFRKEGKIAGTMAFRNGDHGCDVVNFDDGDMQRMIFCVPQEDDDHEMVSRYLGDTTFDNDCLDSMRVSPLTTEDLWPEITQSSMGYTPLQPVNCTNQSESFLTDGAQKFMPINPARCQTSQWTPKDAPLMNLANLFHQPMMVDQQAPITAHPEMPTVSRVKNLPETAPPRRHQLHGDSISLTSSDSGNQSGESCDSSPFQSPSTGGCNPLAKRAVTSTTFGAHRGTEQNWEKELIEHRERKRNEILERAFEKLRSKLPESITANIQEGPARMSHLDILRSAVNYIQFLQALYVELKPLSEFNGSNAVTENDPENSKSAFETPSMDGQLSLDMLMPE